MAGGVVCGLMERWGRRLGSRCERRGRVVECGCRVCGRELEDG